MTDVDDTFPDLPLLPPLGSRAGASGLGADDELPLVVWLRGDEPHCGEFTLDADEVMRQLGIRRSRLTQISGKELRVGRIRRGRYVSPVFRQVDVDQYLSWTRATASHQKSSAVIEEAAEALRGAGDELASRLEAVPRELLAGMEETVRAAALDTQRAVHERAERLERLPDELVALAQAGALESNRVRDALTALQDTLAQLLGRGEAQALLTEKLLGDVGEVAGLVRVTREDLTAEVARAATRQDELVARLAEVEGRLAAAEEALAPPPSRPRRGAADARRIRRLVARDAAATPRPAAPRPRRQPRRS